MTATEWLELLGFCDTDLSDEERESNFEENLALLDLEGE